MGIASLGGILSGAGNVNAPDPNNVRSDWMQMMSGYLTEQYPLYQSEAEFQPQYNALSNRNLTATRTSGVGDVNALSPNILNILRGYNPQQTGLLDTLTGQAQQQLALNGALDPAMQQRIQQNIRSSQAARGLGYGPGDAAMEQYYQTQTQEQRRQANQALASQVATQTQNTYRDPFQIMLGYSNPANATPAITSTGSMLNFMGVPYQGGLSAATSTAQNVTGLYKSMDENSTKFMSGMLSTAGICWVAREVYGENNPKWRQFRAWLISKAPRWLYKLYKRHGEAFAKVIHNKPVIKWIIRKAMDCAISTQMN